MNETLIGPGPPSQVKGPTDRPAEESVSAQSKSSLNKARAQLVSGSELAKRKMYEDAVEGFTATLETLATMETSAESVSVAKVWRSANLVARLLLDHAWLTSEVLADRDAVQLRFHPAPSALTGLPYSVTPPQPA